MYIQRDKCYKAVYSPIAYIVLREFNKLFSTLVFCNKTLNQHYIFFRYSDGGMWSYTRKIFWIPPNISHFYLKKMTNPFFET